MYKFVFTEIITRGKEAEDKAWRKKQAKRFEELGFPPLKVYSVIGREQGRVYMEIPEFETWEEWMQIAARFGSDEVLLALEEERAEKGMVVEGSNEGYLLTDY